jgi:parallel beta-helix repeat protein
VTTEAAFSGYRISDNTFDNNVFGLYFNSGGSSTSTARDNCFNDNNQSGSASGNGIYEDQGLTNAVISRNVFTGNTSSAVVLVTASNVTVAANTSRADGTLLALVNSSGGTVSRNRATDDPGTAIYVCGSSGTSIRENAVERSGAGLFVDGPADSCSASTQLEVGNNQFNRSSTYGIYVASSSLSSSTIENNRAKDSAADGIYMASGMNTLVHNRVSDSGLFDCHDVTTGTGTAGTANTWRHNQGSTSSPAGICSRGEREE